MVERRDSYDGAWGEGPDDDLGHYPAAPIPAHERTWRHPSEVGQAQWAQSEPPLAIGRGLMATTGLVGCTLGLAVVWLLVPGGLDQQPVAGPTVTRSVGAAGMATADLDPPIDLLSPTTALARPTTTLPTTINASRTVSVQTSASAATATAVLIEGTGLLLTTAAAVREQRRVAVEDASANIHETSVVGSIGDLVVLTADAPTDTPVDVVGFGAIGRADEGEGVVVLGPSPLRIDYPGGDEVIELRSPTDAADISEGAPVVDADGVLVALCTHAVATDGSAEVRVVPIADVLASLLGGGPTDSPSTGSLHDDGAPGAGWIGIRLVEITAPEPEVLDRVVVDRVTPDSPAAFAGISVGDAIVAIDGIPVVAVAEVRAALAGSMPGDAVVLRVLSADGSERDVSVVLGVAAPDV